MACRNPKFSKELGLPVYNGGPPETTNKTVYDLVFFRMNKILFLYEDLLNHSESQPHENISMHHIRHFTYNGQFHFIRTVNGGVAS